MKVLGKKWGCRINDVISLKLLTLISRQPHFKVKKVENKIMLGIPWNCQFLLLEQGVV